jgi:hypothetical protein
MKLFQYIVLWHPTDEEKKKGDQSEIIVELTTVLAPDIQGATLLAGRDIGEEYLPKLSQIEVAVRPF